jgi:hypothetical protein
MLKKHLFWKSDVGSELILYGKYIFSKVSIDKQQQNQGEIPILRIMVYNIVAPIWYKIFLYNSDGTKCFEYFHLKVQSQLITDAWISAYNVTNIVFNNAIPYDLSKLTIVENILSDDSSSQSSSPKNRSSSSSPSGSGGTSTGNRKWTLSSRSSRYQHKKIPHFGNLFPNLSPRSNGSDSDSSPQNSPKDPQSVAK